MSKKKSTKSVSSLNSENFRVELKPNQKQVCNFLKSNHISILKGPPGTGKSFIQLFRAVEGLLAGEFSEIIHVRSVAEVGPKIGYLPGAQPYNSKIYTPSGFITMGEIKEGDIVFAYDGTPVEVTGTYEQGERDIYEVTTSDGQSSIVCDKHLWQVTERRAKTAKYRKPVIKNTLEIKEDLYNDYDKYRYSIPRNKGLEWEEKELPIHPYVLGALIGDGSLSDNINLTNPDIEILNRVDKLLKDTKVVINNGSLQHNIKKIKQTHSRAAGSIEIKNLKTNEIFEYNRVGEVPYKKFNCKTLNGLKNRCYRNANIDGFSYRFIENDNKYNNPLKNKLDGLNLLFKKSYEKFIPEIYKMASKEQRLEMLRGLLDTDGNIKENGETTYSTSSKKLAEDVAFIVRSLGGRVFIKERDRIGYTSEKSKYNIISKRLAYEVRINFSNNPGLFHLNRKKERENYTSNLHKNNIVSVEKVGREKVKCIMINHPEHLYITDDFVVTHNTQEEKLDPYQEAFFDNLKDMLNKVNFEKVKKKVRFEHVGFVRGKTFKRAAIILEEGQNLTLHELISVTTRVADTSKLFINCDEFQSDIGNKSGIRPFLSIVDGINGIDVMTLGDEFQMRNQMIVEINNRYVDYLNTKK